MQHPSKLRIVARTRFRALGWALPLVVAVALAPLDATAQQKEAAGAPGKEDLGAVGTKLANPLGSLWSLVMNFETPKFLVPWD